MFCIFDLDGTLIDSLGDLANACNAVLQARDLPAHPEEAYRYFVGDGVAKLIERMLPPKERTQDVCNACRQAFDRYYQSHCLDKTRPYPGIVPLLDNLRAAGAKTAVLSNKPNAFVNQICRVLFGSGRFDFVFGQREGVPNKPAPAGIVQLIKLSGAMPQETVMLGDSAMDMEAAKRAGVYGIGVAWGFRGSDELKAAGASEIVQSPEMLQARLLAMINKKEN